LKFSKAGHSLARLARGMKASSVIRLRKLATTHHGLGIARIFNWLI
jgi:hypothetical protein